MSNQRILETVLLAVGLAVLLGLAGCGEDRRERYYRDRDDFFGDRDGFFGDRDGFFGDRDRSHERHERRDGDRHEDGGRDSRREGEHRDR